MAPGFIGAETERRLLWCQSNSEIRQRGLSTAAIDATPLTVFARNFCLQSKFAQKEALAMTVGAVQFLAITISALALVPSGAHFAALPNKIALPQSEYFTVQTIYYGWAILGLLWPAALIMNALLAVVVRSQKCPFWLAVAAALCFALMFAIFFLWTLPANQATNDWTTAPENWETFRRQWEYSHAANTIIVFVALCFTTLSALSWREIGSP
ncbi:hypothetical protein [Rhizobium sullae]|uniref:hypothetical protein n=1 Tax=Rhizobium sullae TaxID=50338 RepID=UPI001FCDA2F2|nr:hypothetical protein [Rhizobium sullae]